MAEERNVGLARPTDAATSDDVTKAELQRRMEEARESITQTVTEIKETVSNQYQQVRNTISESLDWREQFRRRPLPFTIGALGVGLLVGYSVAGAFKGGDEEEYDEADGAFDRIEQGFDQMQPARSYAAQPILGASTTLRAAAPEREVPGGAYSGGTSSAAGAGDVGPDTRPSYSSGYAASTAPAASGAAAATEEETGPGLFERFKETQAYDRLQQELSTLGSRAVEELSKTAQNVVLPALLSKLKDLIGIDLGTQRQVAQRGRLEHEAARTAAATDSVTEQQSSDAGTGATGGSSSAYASSAGGGSGSSL